MYHWGEDKQQQKTAPGQPTPPTPHAAYAARVDFPLQIDSRTLWTTAATTSWLWKERQPPATGRRIPFGTLLHIVPGRREYKKKHTHCALNQLLSIYVPSVDSKTKTSHQTVTSLETAHVCLFFFLQPPRFDVFRHVWRKRRVQDSRRKG